MPLQQKLTASRSRLVAGVLALSMVAASAFSLVQPGIANAADGAIWPSGARITGVYGFRCLSKTADDHKGYDIGAATGAPVYATQDGTAYEGWIGGYGNTVLVVHSNGYKSLYGHLSKYHVYDGKPVKQGDLIGEVGNTGASQGAHLHFEIRSGALRDGNLNGTPINFNSAIKCYTQSNTTGDPVYVTAKQPVNYTFIGLNGSSSTVYEDVRNGGGTRITGPNSYLDISSQGHVYAWNSQWYGGNPSNYGTRISDAAATNGALGYWMVSTSGHIYAYGNAPWKGGSPTNTGGEIVAMAKMPNDDGYALLSETGNVYNYGSSQWKGGSPIGYSGKFVDIEMMPDGQGYWLLTSAGQIYAYGSARSYGNATNFQRAIVAMSRTANGLGYVMVSKTGQVYAFGNAWHAGSNPSNVPGEVADISYRRDGVNGYLIVGTGGHHYAYNTPWIGNPVLSGAIF